MSERFLRTYQTRVPTEQEPDSQLSQYASLAGHVERRLFADIASGKKISDLKSPYISRYKITARQYNAIAVKLEGKISSVKEKQIRLIQDKQQRIEALEERLPKIKLKKVLHQKKRRLAKLQADLARLQEQKKSGKVPLCFGSGKLFRGQFDLEANGFENHEEWKEAWQDARSNEIFILGSKDEAGGNQSCTASLAPDSSITLRVRLPDALAQNGKYLIIPGIRFAYGHEAVVSAIQSCSLRRELSLSKDAASGNFGQALNFRFKRDSKGWTIFVTTEIQPPPPITNTDNGVISVDINSDHLAIVETDRFGNPVRKSTLPLTLYGKSKHQARALIGDAAAKVISICCKSRKPLVIENLDFQKKKIELRGKKASYCRMLSSFAYNSIIAHLKGRGAGLGIQVFQVNPAYTSLIGRVKFAKRYGLSIHHAAALCIGRRFLGVSERMPQGIGEIPDGKGCHVALALPARNRARHVWHQWGQLSRRLPAALAAHFRTAKGRSSSSRKAAPGILLFPGIAGEIPAREPSTQLLC